MNWNREYNICLVNVIEWKYEAAENAYSRVKYKYLNCTEVLSYFPSL